MGNLGNTVQQNLIGEKLIAVAAAWIANDLNTYSSVLDVGCGYGRLATSFCDAGFDYIGIDVAPAAIEAARQREPRGEFILGSALDVKIDRKFDVVTFTYVSAHFVDDDDWAALIRAFVGRLLDGGAILIADDFPEVEKRPADHVYQRPLSQYVREFGKYGLIRDVEFKEKLSYSELLAESGRPFELFRAPNSQSSKDHTPVLATASKPTS